MSKWTTLLGHTEDKDPDQLLYLSGSGYNPNADPTGSGLLFKMGNYNSWTQSSLLPFNQNSM